MSDFSATWELVRGRFESAISGLTHEQLKFRLHPGTLSAGEIMLHVAGVEVSFATQLLGQTPEGLEARIKAAATDGTLNDKPFPFSPDEITPEFAKEALAHARAMVEPLITNPDAYRDREIVSAIGPIIDGTGAFARLAYHPSYHHGQIHFLVTAPGFPSA